MAKAPAPPVPPSPPPEPILVNLRDALEEGIAAARAGQPLAQSSIVIIAADQSLPRCLAQSDPKILLIHADKFKADTVPNEPNKVGRIPTAFGHHLIELIRSIRNSQEQW